MKKLLLLLSLVAFLARPAYSEVDSAVVDKLQSQSVMIKVGNVSGSGTLITRANPNGGESVTFVLTCGHLFEANKRSIFGSAILGRFQTPKLSNDLRTQSHCPCLPGRGIFVSGAGGEDLRCRAFKADSPKPTGGSTKIRRACPAVMWARSEPHQEAACPRANRARLLACFMTKFRAYPSGQFCGGVILSKGSSRVLVDKRPDGGHWCRFAFAPGPKRTD
jgi:hypothetical protein